MNDPMLLLKSYLEHEVEVKCRNSTPFKFILFGFDEHCNVIGVKKESKDKLLFVRGDKIISIGRSTN